MMDTRIIALLVIVSVAGSLVDAQVPFYRVRRNGLQESDITAGREFIETPRAKRQSILESSGIAESTGTPKPKDAATAPSTTPANASPKKPNPTTKPNPPNPTRPTPAGSSTTPKQSPSTRAAKPTPAKPDPTTSAPESTEESTTPEPTDPETSDEQESTTPKVGLGSRINTEEPVQAKKPQTKPSIKPAPSNPSASGSPQSQPGYPQVPLFTFPNFAPDYSSPYNPYGDPTFNSIPGPNNFAWTGTHNGQGAAASFASAGASSAGGFGGGAGYGTKQPSLADRGAFVDNTPNTANSNSGYTPNSGYVPNAGYIPNMGNAGGYGYSGVGNPFPDPSSFAFPGFAADNFQRQMDYFRQWQNEFQKQQQQLFETANRIGTDGYAGQPGAHSAISSISLGPQGGYQAGAINPAAPGIASRFSEDIPAPSGNSYGVFSSSSSKTVVGPDGKPMSHKISTTGVNDNGKITFRTVED